jgi:hypothetical protein
MGQPSVAYACLEQGDGLLVAGDICEGHGLSAPWLLGTVSFEPVAYSGFYFAFDRFYGSRSVDHHNAKA